MSPGGWGAVILTLSGLAGGALAQERSLGEAARQEQARREQSRRAPRADGRTYTNEDLEAIRVSEPRGNLNVIGVAVEDAASPGIREGAPDDGEPASAASAAPRGQDEWRRRGTELRAAMAGAEQRLQAAREESERLREQLSPMAQRYLEDVNERLRLQSALTAAEAATAQAQRDLDQARRDYRDLQDQAQRQRIPPGWIGPAS